MKRTPIKRKRTTKRTYKTPRCMVGRCNKPQRVLDLCASHAKAEADRLFSLFIRERDGKCYAAILHGGDFGCVGNLQCAHVISRRYMNIRYDPGNAMALCAGHHVHWTHRPLEWEEWVRKVAAIDYDNLRYCALHDDPLHPFRLDDVLEHLRSEVAA